MRHYYTIADVRAGALPPHAKLGVVGNPIAHSLSPCMQQAALDAERRGISYVRLLCEPSEAAFRELIDALQKKAGFIGVNVTVPFKKYAFALPHRPCDPMELALRCCAANTLRFFNKGDVQCWNTDGYGFARAIHELSGEALSERRVVLLGACGGAGSALAAQCILAGCKSLALVNRPRPELGALAYTLKEQQKDADIRTLHFGEAALADLLQGSDSYLIVNATSIGLRESDTQPPLPVELLHEKHLVYDLITHDTPLVREAKKRGCIAENGRRMLLWQGVRAYELWFDTTLSADIAESMYAAMLRGANA